MDYQTLETIMRTPEALAIATGIGGFAAGYLAKTFASKNKLNYAQFGRDVRIEEEKTKQSEYETTREQAKADVEKSRNAVELKKLDYQNAGEEHKRDLELMAKQREYRLEDEEKTYTRQKEQTEIQYKKQKNKEDMMQSKEKRIDRQECNK